MSGLYNMLMGRNPLGPYLMGVLGFVQGAPQNAWLGRFRDVYTNDEADRIFILHRNYGNEFTQAIKQHPNFIGYEPDSFDHTYGVWEFTVPEDRAHIVKEIASLGDNTPLMDRYRKLIEDMGKGIDNEATRNAKAVGEKILGPILDQIEGKPTESEQVIEHDGSVVVLHNFKPEGA
jgi:hypothetical protein